MATHYSQPGLPGAPVQQEALTACRVREIQPSVCSWAWDSTLPGDRYVLDMNRKTTSAPRCTLQGERANHDVSSPGTSNVGLGGGKLLQLHILWHEKLPHFFHAWRKESLLWVKHALDKVKTSPCWPTGSFGNNYVLTIQHCAWTIAKLQYIFVE